MDEPGADPRPPLHILGSQAALPDTRPRRGSWIHDGQREEALRGGAGQRVQHLLGSLHLVHLQAARGHQAGPASQSVRFGEHHEGKVGMVLVRFPNCHECLPEASRLGNLTRMVLVLQFICS